MRLKDKLTILDVRATDQEERSFQIEVQIEMHPGLSGRMVFTWAELLTRQLKEGEDYPRLRPAIAIWLMGGILFRTSPDFHHYLTMTDAEKGVSIEKSSGIHVLELPKWSGRVQNELDRWLRFFREGESLDGDSLPAYMRTPEMEQTTGEPCQQLMQFSEDEEAYQRYRHARDERRYSNTIHHERDMAVKRADEAELERDAVKARAEKAEAELQQLRQLLRAKGIEPS